MVWRTQRLAAERLASLEASAPKDSEARRDYGIARQTIRSRFDAWRQAHPSNVERLREIERERAHRIRRLRRSIDVRLQLEGLRGKDPTQGNAIEGRAWQPGGSA